MAELRRQKFPGIEDVPHLCIWKKEVPTKVQGFLWLVFLGRILTLDNLQQRGLITPNWCSLCNCAAESVDHIFLACTFSWKVWSLFSSILSISGPLHHRMREVVMGWKGMNCTTNFVDTMGVCLYAFCWFIWLERNNRIFRDISSSEEQTAYRISSAVGSWLVAAGVFSKEQLEHWAHLCAFHKEPD
ncbi:hypothetical protein LINGRAHAP2_LOCUS7101 [Linum grandiflorum]